MSFLPVRPKEPGVNRRSQDPLCRRLSVVAHLMEQGGGHDYRVTWIEPYDVVAERDGRRALQLDHDFFSIVGVERIVSAWLLPLLED